MGNVTKKCGKTEVYPFWNMEDIKNMMDYFESKGMWHWYLAFNLGLLLGRRVSDTLSFKWHDFYFENGRMKEGVDVREQKTGKTARLFVCGACKDAILLYQEKTGIDPMENFHNFVIPTEQKEKLLQGRSNYTEDEFEKLMWTATQSQATAYRKQFKIAADACGITYPVSTHSTRKTFGYWSVKLHPYDVTTIDKLQNIFNHSDRNTTLHYIGLSWESDKQLYSDMGDFIVDVKNGEKPVIKNSPVVSLKSEDFRELISQCYDMAKSDMEKFDCMNEILGKSEEFMV